MAKTNVPRYYGLRIYLSTTLLFFFLIIPFLMFLAVQNAPRFAENQRSNLAETSEADSLNKGEEVLMLMDSLAGTFEPGDIVAPESIDSIVNQAVRLGEQIGDSVTASGTGSPIQVTVEEEVQGLGVVSSRTAPKKRAFRKIRFVPRQ